MISTGADPSALNLYWYNPAANAYILQQDVTGAAPVIDTVNLQLANEITLDAVNTFTTTLDSNVVTVAATGHGYSEGDVVYLNNVSAPVDGIPAAEFNGQAFRITNVTANTFDIEVVTTAATGMAVNDAAVTSLAADTTQPPGMKSRTGNGGFTVDLSAAPASSFYLVRADVMVEDDEGNITTSTVEYRVSGGQTETINQRYPARAASGGGTLNVPTSHQPLIRAQLVDAEGNVASAEEAGYLQIVAQEVPGEPGIDDRVQVGRRHGHALLEHLVQLAVGLLLAHPFRSDPEAGQPEEIGDQGALAVVGQVGAQDQHVARPLPESCVSLLVIELVPVDVDSQGRPELGVEPLELFEVTPFVEIARGELPGEVFRRHMGVAIDRIALSRHARAEGGDGSRRQEDEDRSGTVREEAVPGQASAHRRRQNGAGKFAPSHTSPGGVGAFAYCLGDFLHPRSAFVGGIDLLHQQRCVR